MKRPFCAIGFTGFTVMLLLSLADSNLTACCVLFISALIGVFSLFRKNLRQALTVPVCFFTAAAACLLFLSFNSQKLAVQSLTGDALEVKATVAEAPYIKNENNRRYCVLELLSVDGKEASGRLRLSFSPEADGIDESRLEIGNRISFTGKVYVPGESEKSISRFFTGENILLGAYGARNVAVTESVQKGSSYCFQKLRDLVTEKLCYSFGGKTAGLLIGMLTGDKSSLDAKLYDTFRKTGLAHLLAVSGLHLSLWVYAVSALIPEKRKTAKLRTALLMSAVIFIMLLAGMSESVKRAGFMSLVFLSGKLLRQDCDSLNSLGFAVTVMLLYNPACVLSLSLQLSFLSTLGILTVGKLCIERSAVLFGGKKINSPSRRLMRYIADMFFISLSVLIFTSPVLIFSFGGISTVSAWVNMLISPVVSPLLICAGICVLLSSVPFLFYPVALFVKLLSAYVVFVTEIFAETENAFLVADSESIPLFIAAALITWLSITAFLKSFKGRSLTVAVCIVVSSLLILSVRLYQGNDIKLHLTAYEDTLAFAVERDKKAVLLYDTDEYEKGIFVSALSEKGINAFYELEDGDRLILKSLCDGKYITDESTLSVFDGFSVNITTGEKIIEAGGKYIHIFYGEALQYEPCCDIIIQIQKDDVTVITENDRFSLKENSSLTLSVRQIMRGEGSWLNLMKSNLRLI